MTRTRRLQQRRSWIGYVFSGFLIAALVGLSIFGFLAWRSVAVEHAGPEQAAHRFAQVRERFSGTEPLLRVQPDGQVIRGQDVPGGVIPATRLRVLAYRSAQRRTVEANVPFWFLEAKGPALQLSLRHTGLDFNRLGLTPAVLQRYGAILVLDESGATGDRLLVWTE